MREELETLLDRMTRRETYVSSGQSASWAAHREAESLDDPSMVDELVRAIDGKTPKSRRRASYFIIGKIGQNLQNVRCAEALIGLLAFETDAHGLYHLFQSLERLQKANTLDVSPLYSFLSDTRPMVRHGAIRALSRSQCPEVEDRVLEHLARATEPIDQIYCHATLNESGTAKSLPALTANLSSRKRDVKASAELAISAIRERESA